MSDSKRTETPPGNVPAEIIVRTKPAPRRIEGTPVKRDTPPNPGRRVLSGMKRGGFPVEDVAPWLLRPEHTRKANTSEAWARERKARAEADGIAGKADIPTHKLPGGENELPARLRKATAGAVEAGEDTAELRQVVRALEAEERETLRREDPEAYEAMQPKPKKRRRGRR